MEFSATTPPANRLTNFLTLGTQSPVDCVNGHAIEVAGRGGFDLTEFDDVVDVETLICAFPSRSR